jgi:hypothetical protein
MSDPWFISPSLLAEIRSGSDITEMNSGGGPTTYTELLTVAATEVCAYLGRISASRKPERNRHAPARRTARTMVSNPTVMPSFLGLKYAVRA